MPLDNRFILNPIMMDVFRDESTGLPLRNGEIEFFEDLSRTTPKNVFVLSGAPPNYTYVSIGPTITLNNAGYITQQIYFFPFDGDETTTTNTIDRYFIQIKDQVGQIQETREAWPNAFADDATTNIDNNFISNGQFIDHNDLLEEGTFAAGEIREAITDIARGGFTFARPVGSTAKDFVTFERFGSFVSPPPPFKGPRYAVKVVNQMAGSDTFKDLRIKFNDVNKFSSSTELFTFSFSAKSASGAQISVFLVKNYGTGGQGDDTVTLLANKTLTSAYQTITPPSFTFGDNSSKTIGPDDDDFLQLIIQFPLDIAYEAELTGFLLAEGMITDPIFENETNREMIQTSLGGGFPIPSYDGSDLFLPPILTKTGWQFHNQSIGQVYYVAYDSPAFGELLCDGSKLDRFKSSSDGIPFSRLFNQIGIKFGNGLDFAFSTALASKFILANNTASVVSAPTNGAPSPGFTFSNINTGISPGTGNFVDVHLRSGNELVFENRFISTIAVTNAGAQEAPTPETSALTLSVPASRNGYKNTENQAGLFDVSFSKSGFVLSGLPATGSGLVGAPMAKHFNFDTMENPTTVKQYFVWFTVDGVGVNPSPPGRTGILVPVLSTDVTAVLALKIQYVLRGTQTTEIQAVTGTLIPANSYWTFNTNVDNYYVWYAKDGAGTDPLVANRIGIQVLIVSADTADQVVTATVKAVNERFFAVPDARGLFIRGTDALGTNDLDFANRYNPITNVLGGFTGTRQDEDVRSHNHPATGKSGAGGGGSGGFWAEGGQTDPPANTGFSGTTDTRPMNLSFNVVITY